MPTPLAAHRLAPPAHGNACLLTFCELAALRPSERVIDGRVLARGRLLPPKTTRHRFDPPLPATRIQPALLR